MNCSVENNFCCYGKCYHCVEYGFSSRTYLVSRLLLLLMQEAVAVTTAIQEEIFLEMGVGKSVL